MTIRDFERRATINALRERETHGDAISRNALMYWLNKMDRYVSGELRLCDTDEKFPQNEVFIVDDVYEAVEQLSSIRPKIIYCKDCEHNASKPEAANANCELFYGMTDQYGFCSQVERRHDEGD